MRRVQIPHEAPQGAGHGGRTDSKSVGQRSIRWHPAEIGDGRRRLLVSPAKKPTRSVTERLHESSAPKSCVGVRLPMQHDGRAPRWYRGGFGSISNVGSGNPENIARAMQVGTATSVRGTLPVAGISLGEKPVFQTVPAEFESRCPLSVCRCGR